MSVQLNEICELIVDCPHSTAFDEGEGYPLIRTPNIGPGYFDLEGVHRVGKAAYDKRNQRAVPRANDLILAREAPAGNVAIIPDGAEFCLGQRTVLIRPDAQKVCPLFLNYYLNAPEQRHKLLRNANGATVSHVNMPVIRNLPVDLPSFEEQKRIADVLSAYDSLIENNRKQIKLLEEAAQRLYKEWFIDLRFPGHEDTEIDPDTELPEGWTLQTFDDVCESIGGGTPSTSVSSYWANGTIPWVTPSDVTNNTGLYLPKSEKCIAQEGLNNSSARLLPKQAILMTSRASIGYIAICDMPAATNQGFISCIPRHDHIKWWLVFELHNRVPEFKLLAKGSTFLELSRSTFRKMKVILPSRQVLESFSSTIETIFDAEMTIRREIDFLIEARNRLLPKLIEGEVVL